MLAFESILKSRGICLQSTDQSNGPTEVWFNYSVWEFS